MACLPLPLAPAFSMNFCDGTFNPKAVSEKLSVAGVEWYACDCLRDRQKMMRSHFLFASLST
jgi:hypothetical protein